MERLHKFIYSIYLFMRRHRFTFRVSIFLREIGLQGYIKRRLKIKKDRKLWKEEREHPTEEMMETEKFIQMNQQRIMAMLEMLSDAKSKKVWKAVMKFKAKRVPIPQELYSTKDEYFAKDIITLKNGEVFVDGGHILEILHSSFLILQEKDILRLIKW